MNNSLYLYRTRYSNQYTTWVKRIVILLALAIVILAWIFSDDEYDSWWLVFPVLILIFLGILFSPVDDIAIDQRNFFHLKTSLLSFLNKSESFDISQMRSIAGISDLNAISDQNKYVTIIEMTFKDGSMKSFKVSMLRKEIDECLERVKQMMVVN